MARTKSSRFIAMLLVVIMVFSAMPITALTANAAEMDENRTIEDLPSNAIAINSAWELSMICNEYPSDGYYVLTTDIDLSSDVAENGDFYDNGKGWTPIGNKAMPFTGTFDGQGHIIKNLSINRTTDYTALFGYTSGATIYGLTLENSIVTGGGYTAAIVGGAENSEFHELSVKNCKVSGTSNVGGILGYGFGISLHDCDVISGTVQANSTYCGGVSGRLVNMAGTTTLNCTSSTAVTGVSYVGGLFGELTGSSAVIDNCKNSGAVKGTSNNVAGIVGGATSTTVKNCENSGRVESRTGLSVTYVGGIAGNCQTVTNCVNRGSVIASLKESTYRAKDNSGDGPQSTSYAGGIVGDATKVSKCFNAGALYVSGGEYTYWTSVSTPTGGYVTTRTRDYYTYGGGIAGNADTIEFCYNTGSITGNEANVVGALVSGSRAATVSNCYSDANNIPLVRNSSNTVTNCYNTNGLIAASGTATNCYYFADAESGIGALRTKRQLRAQITFVDWDFDNVWTLEGNGDYLYPELLELPSEFEKRVTSVSLVSTPEKTNYLEGKDVIDVSQIKLKVYYDNETQEQLDVTEDMLSGFDNSIVGTKTIRVTYEGFYDEFEIVIIAKSVVAIEMESLPTKVAYLEGKDWLDVVGGKILVSYNNDTTQSMDLTLDMISGFDNAEVGTQILTVTYQGKETSFNIEITPKSITGIEINTLPQKLEYIEGDQLSLNGGTITINYDNDTYEQKDMSECEVSITELSEYGQANIVVTYGGFKVSFSVNVDHAYFEQHSYDSNHHWLVCDCGGESEKQAHQYDNICDTSCNVCDYIRAITHTYTADCDETCDVCSYSRSVAVDHTYSNACDTDCNVCGTVRAVLGHMYSNACDTTCNECGATRTVPDHNYINDCDTTCNECGATRAVEPHYVLVEMIPYTMQNSTSYPFTHSNGWYTSTNKGDSSSSSYTITATASVTIEISYKVSSETNYDKLVIKKNSSQLKSVSGSVSGSLSVTLAAGDQLTFTYSKDSSQSSGTDNASFKIDSHVGNLIEKVLAEEVPATCSGPVVCTECGLTVKAALEHSYDNTCDTNCNECDYVRTITHTYTANCDETCNICSYNRIALANHTYSNGCDTMCNNCGAVRTVAGHVYSNACDATCNECNSTRTVPDHIYTNGCDTTCNECGATRTTTGHMYSNACDTTCNECSATRTVTGHVYTHTCDTTCNECSYIRNVQHTFVSGACNICGLKQVPVAIRVSATSVTLAPYTGYEYSKDGATWQTSNVFTGLTANTAYTFYQRIAETEQDYASEKSSKLEVKTNPKGECSIIPIAPIISDYTSTTVTLLPLDGYEYSKNGTTWQSSNVFTNLSGNTTYTFYQRVKETAEEYASEISAPTSVKTASANYTTSATNYDRLRNYINNNGNVGSNGNKTIVFNSMTSSNGITSYFAMENTDEGILLTYLTSSDASTKVVNILELVLKRDSEYMTITGYMLYYYNGTCLDAISEAKTVARYSYYSTKTYSFTKSGSYIKAADFSKASNNSLNLLTKAFETYIFPKLGFGLKGLGFISYDYALCNGACDVYSDYHCGETEIRNSRPAGCIIDGYTGDTYCKGCGEKLKSGTAIACAGSHKYDNSCDTACNACSEPRKITHTYSGVCDTSCDVCNASRTTDVNHEYDNDSDQVCNVCQSLKYLVGDTDCSKGIDKDDAIYLLMATFFPEDYPLDQNCDFDGNNKVDKDDAIYLLMYTFFPEDYPLTNQTSTVYALVPNKEDEE